jgi:hypothetical protein
MEPLWQSSNSEDQFGNYKRLALFWGPAVDSNFCRAFGWLAAVPAQHAIRAPVQQPGIQRIIEIFANRPAHRARALDTFVPQRAGPSVHAEHLALQQ